MTSPVDATVAGAEEVGPRGTSHWVPWAGTWAGILSAAAVMSLGYVAILHGQRGYFTGMVTILVCLLAGLFDAWTTRIPNRLTYGAILLGLGLNAAAGLCARLHLDTAVKWLGAAGPAECALGFGACALLGLIGFAIRAAGGGDVKMLAALGALLGLSQTAVVLLVAIAAAVVYGLFNLVAMGKINEVVRWAAHRVMEALYGARAATVDAGKGAGAFYVPMTVPLVLGVAVAEAGQLAAALGRHP